MEFIKINPLEFSGTKVDEVSENFIEKVQRILCLIDINEIESVYFPAYQLKKVPRTVLNQWRKYLGDGVAPQDWNIFEEAFIGKLFP